jgi:hypothetical protein
MQISTKILSKSHVQVHLGNKIVVLFSYRTPVAALVDDKYYRNEENYSRVTTTQVNKWLSGVPDEDIEMVSEEFLALLIPAKAAAALGMDETAAFTKLKLLGNRL